MERETGERGFGRGHVRAHVRAIGFTNLIIFFSPSSPPSRPFFKTPLEYIAAIYAEMRDDEARARVPHSYTTARTLLSILRLATALARLRFAGEVGQAEVDEALRLMRMSKHSLLDGGAGGGVGAAGRRANDPVSAVYYALRDAARASGTTTYAWADLVALLGRSFSHDAIRAAVEEYAEYNVLSVEYPRPNEPTVHFA
jgi:DNA replication licensing factor MCM7